MNAANRHTPLFQGHGDRDAVVQLKEGTLAHDTISKFNEKATLEVFPGMAHSSSPAEMRQVFAFVQKQLQLS
jgi:predicted esterase